VTGDFVTLDGVRYLITDTFPVYYEMQESPAERKARGKGPAPMVAYTSCRIERLED
jgi:hypothetical protein